MRFIETNYNVDQDVQQFLQKFVFIENGEVLLERKKLLLTLLEQYPDIFEFDEPTLQTLRTMIQQTSDDDVAPTMKYLEFRNQWSDVLSFFDDQVSLHEFLRKLVPVFTKYIKLYGREEVPERKAEETSDISIFSLFGIDSDGSENILERVGIDLTERARKGAFDHLQIRHREYTMMIEILGKIDSRNPVLVGPAGVGKSSIVQVLAREIVQGRVPDFLLNTKVIEISPSHVYSGSEVIEKVKSIIEQAKKEKTILFLDELHVFLEPESSVDIGQFLKPALARNEITIIGATTDYEYRKYIEEDRAFTRRFTPIWVREPTGEEIRPILDAWLDKISEQTKLHIPPSLCEDIIDLAQRYLKNKHFPHKAIELLNFAVGHARANRKANLTIDEIKYAVRQFTGFLPDMEKRLQECRDVFLQKGVLQPFEIDAIVSRLQLTLGGYDIHWNRPNLLLALLGERRAFLDEIARIFAAVLYKNEENIIVYDMTQFQASEDITKLIGAGPSYVGYKHEIPIYRVISNPFQVIVFRNYLWVHPQIHAFLENVFASGTFIDAIGRKISLAETVVLLDIDIEFETKHALGFTKGDESPPDERKIESMLMHTLGQRFVKLINVFLFHPYPYTSLRTWLDDYFEQWGADHGVSIHITESMYSYVTHLGLQTKEDVREWLEKAVLPFVIPYLPKKSNIHPSLTLSIVDGKVHVRANAEKSISNP